MKRFELSTLSLARRCSTTELHPHEGWLPCDRLEHRPDYHARWSCPRSIILLKSVEKRAEAGPAKGALGEKGGSNREKDKKTIHLYQILGVKSCRLQEGSRSG